jgi:outer membrane murein-binding lipoprotein Lpp
VVGKIDQVSHEIGRLSATLHDIREAIERDRADSAAHRKEVREKLDKLSTAAGEIAPLKKRVDRMEPVVNASARTIAAASLIVGGAISILVIGLKTFGDDIKTFILRLLRVL